MVLKNILTRRRSEVVAVDEVLDADCEGYVQLHDGILLDEPRIKYLQM